MMLLSYMYITKNKPYPFNKYAYVKIKQYHLRTLAENPVFQQRTQ